MVNGRLKARASSVAQRYRALTAPREDGLPNRRVVAAPLLLLVLVLLGFTAVGVTGSSTGILHSDFETGADQDLLANAPLAIRSDEWFVQTSWTIAQVQQGLPTVNETFPGGMDATVQHDLPSRDWSVAFRPHLWGFLVLPLDNAMAWKWWVPGFAAIAAVYLFAVTLLPRRPAAAAMLALGFFFAPFFQWWYLPITFWPVAWAFLVMSTAVWLLRSSGRLARTLLPILCGYVTVTMGVGVYVPFIVPAVYVALAFVVGVFLTRPVEGALRAWGTRLRALVPLVFAAVGAGVVLALWLVTRWATIENFLGTVYPGQRLWPTGTMNRPHTAALLSAPYSAGLAATGGVPFSVNQSEASTFFLTGLFLLGVLGWLVIHRWRRERAVDWLSVALIAVSALFGAFLWVKGWDSVAHLIGLDRTTAPRLRIGLGMLSIVIVVVVAARLKAPDPGVRPPRPPWWLGLGALIAVLAVNGKLVRSLVLGDAAVLQASWSWELAIALYVVGVYLSARGLATVSAAGFLSLSLVTSGGVNPLYRGVFDINETRIGKEVKALSEQTPGAWVGVGTTALPGVILVQSGEPAYNGVQSAPPQEMWEQIDPGGRYEEQWNRLGSVSWRVGEGEPVPQNPWPDQISLNFDSCSDFAQEHVTWVLADHPLEQACVRPVEELSQGPTDLWVYRVTR